MSLFNEKNLDQITLDCPNPKCNKEIEITISEIVQNHKAKCPKCYSQIEFHYSVLSNLKSEIAKIEKLKDDIMNNAKINIRG